MNQRLLRSVVAAVVLAAGFLAGTLHAQTDSTRAAAGPGTGSRAEPGVMRGNLFSAVTFGDSAFGAEWSRLRAEAQSRYPDLKLTLVEDLHVTVVYIGGGWKPADLDRIRALALVVPAASVRHTPEVVRMGRNQQVVAIELHGASRVWADSVVSAKAALNRLGLKKPESYDADFRTHITLAQARNHPPTAADSTALDGFRSWLATRIAKAPDRFSVTVGPTTRVQLLLAGTARPEGAPDYVTVEEFLEQPTGSPVGK